MRKLDVGVKAVWFGESIFHFLTDVSLPYWHGIYQLVVLSNEYKLGGLWRRGWGSWKSVTYSMLKSEYIRSVLSFAMKSSHCVRELMYTQPSWSFSSEFANHFIKKNFLARLNHSTQRRVACLEKHDISGSFRKYPQQTSKSFKVYLFKVWKLFSTSHDSQP